MEYVYERTPAADWPAMLRFLEERAAQELPDVWLPEARVMLVHARAAYEAGADYPSSSDELWDLLTHQQQDGRQDEGNAAG